MERLTLPSCIVVLGLAARFPAAAQHQTVVDAPYLEENVIGVLPAPEGGTYAAGRIPAVGGGTLTIFRFNMDGTLAWERVLDQVPGGTPNDFVNAHSFIPGSEGGVVVNGYGTPYVVLNSGPALDTATVRHVFTEISAQGDISAMWTLTKLMVDQAIVTNDYEIRHAVRDPNGGYFLLLDYFGGLPSQELLRLSASGELLWARSIGRPASGFADIFPTTGELGLPSDINQTRLLSSTSGDVYILNRTIEPFGALKVKKVTPTDELTWVRTYEFIGIDGSTAKSMDAILDGTGNIHVYYRYGYPNQAHTAMKIGSDGELLSVDVFELNYTGYAYSLMVANNGDRFMGVRAVNPNENALFHLATGGVVQRTLRSITVQDPYLLSTNSFDWNLSNDQIRMVGLIEEEHQIFSTILRYPLVVNLPVQDFALCDSYNSNGTYVTMPLENLAVAISTEDISVDITDQWSSAPSMLYTSTEPQPYPLFDLCGLGLGVAAVERGDAQHYVRQNLLTSGEPIMVDVPLPTRIDIIAVDGRAIATTNSTIGANTISTSSYPPGIYLVRASGMDGHLRWCERVTLQ